MPLVYTPAQLAAQAATLRPMFDKVAVVDAATQARLDPATLAPLAAAAPLALPALDAQGRGWLPAPENDNVTLYFCQAVQVEGRELVLAAGYTLPGETPEAGREANAFQRMLYRYIDEMRRDYVTGAYNRCYLEDVFCPAAAARAAAGTPVCVAMATVEEYPALLAAEGLEAAERCLNAAAGLLRIALQPGWSHAILARIKEGTFLLAADTTPEEMEASLHRTLESGRRHFSISLSRRGTFTVSFAVAPWAGDEVLKKITAAAQA